MDELVIIAHDLAYNQLGYRAIEDLEKGLGPLKGIYTALMDTTTRLNFIVSCDMPFITTEAVVYIISRAYETEITIPTIDLNISW